MQQKIYIHNAGVIFAILVKNRTPTIDIDTDLCRENYLLKGVFAGSLRIAYCNTSVG